MWYCHMFQSAFNVGLIFISYNHYTFHRKILNKLVSQHYKSLVGHVLKKVCCNGFLCIVFCLRICTLGNLVDS